MLHDAEGDDAVKDTTINDGAEQSKQNSLLNILAHSRHDFCHVHSCMAFQLCATLRAVTQRRA